MHVSLGYTVPDVKLGLENEWYTHVNNVEHYIFVSEDIVFTKEMTSLKGSGSKSALMYANMSDFSEIVFCIYAWGDC